MQTHTSRRRFLGGCALIATGAAAGSIVTSSLRTSRAIGADQQVSAEARVRQLKLNLPVIPTPVATYVPAVRVDNLLFVSGTGPRRPDGTFIQGRVGIQGRGGSDLTLAEGNAAARLVGLNMLATVRGTLGSLDKVVRLVRTLGMVNSTPDFKQHPQVINGFSDLMVEVFGEKLGKGARAAVGMGSLPSNIPVEIEAIFQVRD